MKHRRVSAGRERLGRVGSRGMPLRYSKIGIASLLFLSAAAGIYLVFLGHAATNYPVDRMHYSILVVAGQSNAAGNESLAYDPANGFDLFGVQKHPADTTTGIVWRLFSGNQGSPAALLNTPQYSSAQDKTIIFGPEVGLSRRLYDKGYTHIIILKVAYGAQTLSAGTPSSTSFNWNVNSNNMAYQKLTEAAGNLASWLDSQGASHSVDGFYWMQGESDANADSAPLYEANLRALITQSRKDLGMSSQAPFVIGKTSLDAMIAFDRAYGDRKSPCGAQYTCDQLSGFNTAVRTAQQRVADTMAGTFIVDTLPLARTGIQIHLANSSQLTLGKQFANAAPLPFQAPPPPPNPQPNPLPIPTPGQTPTPRTDSVPVSPTSPLSGVSVNTSTSNTAATNNTGASPAGVVTQIKTVAANLGWLTGAILIISLGAGVAFFSFVRYQRGVSNPLPSTMQNNSEPSPSTTKAPKQLNSKDRNKPN